MDFGVHLPVMDFGGNLFTLTHLLDYTDAAADLGFDTLAVNDHMVFSVPWLDGPTALAAVLSRSRSMTVATTVSLPVVRGPVPVAKTLAAIDILSGGRLVAAVGPGSSPQDYEAVGVEFQERWTRLDESIRALRALWRGDAEPFVGRHYSTAGIRLLPAPPRPDGIPIWVGSWGSDAGLRRVARLGNGWLASAYNTTPELFGEAWNHLRALVSAQGGDAGSFPNALATMWFYLTDDRADAERVMQERVVPTIHRAEDELRARLPIGPADQFIEKLDAFARAGVQRVLLWPVADEIEQIERFWTTVRPALS